MTAVKPPSRRLSPRTAVVVAFLVGAVVSGALGQVGFAALLAAIALGLGTFSGGGPKNDGIRARNSTPGGFFGG